MTRRSSRRAFLRTLTGSAMGLTVGNAAASVFAQAPPRAPTNVRVGLTGGTGTGTAIAAVTGPLTHGSRVTITGSGFGTKTIQTPTVWDDCSGTDIRAKWDGFWPNASSDPYVLQYRNAPYRNVSAPHNRVNRFLVGGQYPGTNAANGGNIMVWHNYLNISRPFKIYASWYCRVDPLWRFGLGDTPDNNFKTADISTGPEPYTGAQAYSSIMEFNNPTNEGSWSIWDLAGHTYWPSTQGGCRNPLARWVHVEHILNYDDTNGYLEIWDTGVPVWSTSGTPTDTSSDPNRTFAIGGFSRVSANPADNVNQFRYYADLYLDNSWCRVILGNAATLAASTIREPQPYSAWADNSITVTLNQGAFASGSGAYLFVVDHTNRPSAGYRVTLA